MIKHLLHPHLKRRIQPQNYVGKGIADQDQVYARLIHQRGKGIIVGGKHGNLTLVFQGKDIIYGNFLIHCLRNAKRV